MVNQPNLAPNYQKPSSPYERPGLTGHPQSNPVYPDWRWSLRRMNPGYWHTGTLLGVFAWMCTGYIAYYKGWVNQPRWMGIHYGRSLEQGLETANLNKERPAYVPLQKRLAEKEL